MTMIMRMIVVRMMIWLPSLVIVRREQHKQGAHGNHHGADGGAADAHDDDDGDDDDDDDDHDGDDDDVDKDAADDDDNKDEHDTGGKRGNNVRGVDYESRVVGRCRRLCMAVGATRCSLKLWSTHNTNLC